MGEMNAAAANAVPLHQYNLQTARPTHLLFHALATVLVNATVRDEAYRRPRSTVCDSSGDDGHDYYDGGSRHAHNDISGNEGGQRWRMEVG